MAKHKAEIMNEYELPLHETATAQLLFGPPLSKILLPFPPICQHVVTWSSHDLGVNAAALAYPSTSIA
jgi:hypothetical protein